jgi:hypothetical protein
LLTSFPKTKDLINFTARKVQQYAKLRFSDQRKALKQVLFEILSSWKQNQAQKINSRMEVFFNRCQQDTDEAEQIDSGDVSANEKNVVEPLFLRSVDITSHESTRTFDDVHDILNVTGKTITKGDVSFKGVCIDTGVQKSAVVRLRIVRSQASNLFYHLPQPLSDLVTQFTQA